MCVDQFGLLLKAGYSRLSFWWCVALAGLPMSVAASISANLTWIPSPDPNVTGYTICYGGACQQYTNAIAVGNVSSTTITGLQEGLTYFFAAKAHDASGNESDYSNEAIFTGFTVAPNSRLRLKTLPTTRAGDPLTFSLGTDAPAGASINPTNGVFSWSPGREYSSTTTPITIIATDKNNPALSLSETLLIAVTDYLELNLGTTAVQAGQTGSLPLTVSASEGATNLQIILDWPGDRLTNPTLTFTSPVVAGTLQNNQTSLVIQLQLAPGQSLTAATTLAQINFQAVSGQNSAILGLHTTGAVAAKNNASAFANVLAQAGEVVVVGAQSLLRSQASAGQGRAMTVFANPGLNYQLQFTTNLTPPVVWSPLLSYQQTSVSQTVSLDNTEPVIFYRLQQL